MAHEADPFLKQPRQLALQCFAALGGAVAWTLGLSLQYAFVEVACGMDNALLVHLSSLLCFLIALAALIVSVRIWRSTGRRGPGEAGGALPRSRLLAVLGLLASPLFALAIFAQWLGAVFLHPCMGI